MVSLLKAYYGKRATKENDFGYDWLPKLTGDHSHFEFVMRMLDHKVDGYFIMGQNPAVGSQNARLQRQSLARVKWLVVRDLVETAITMVKDGKRKSLEARAELPAEERVLNALVRATASPASQISPSTGPAGGSGLPAKASSRVALKASGRFGSAHGSRGETR